MCLRAHPAGVAVEHAVLSRVEHAAVLVAICSVVYTVTRWTVPTRHIHDWDLALA